MARIESLFTGGRYEVEPRKTWRGKIRLEFNELTMMLWRVFLCLVLFLFAGCEEKPQFDSVSSVTPSPVANAGELVLDGESYLLESASLGAADAGENRIRFLALTGEIVGPEPTLLLFFDLPESVLDTKAVKDAQAMKGEHPAASQDPIGDWKAFVSWKGEKAEVSAGRLNVTSVTGSGPWEIDAEVVLNFGSEERSGTLKAKVSFL